MSFEAPWPSSADDDFPADARPAVEDFNGLSEAQAIARFHEEAAAIYQAALELVENSRRDPFLMRSKSITATSRQQVYSTSAATNGGSACDLAGESLRQQPLFATGRRRRHHRPNQS